ncbi:MAG: selenoneine biosynthesis selenosugar synthase SenB, partial [Polyangiaceae bacterium]
RDYPGLFSVGDTEGLTRMLVRAEDDPAFYEQLVAATRARRDLFAPSAERAAWQRIIDELCSPAEVNRSKEICH